MDARRFFVAAYTQAALIIGSLKTLKQTGLLRIGRGGVFRLPQHIAGNPVEKIGGNFKMPVAQHAGVLLPLAVLAGDAERAIARNLDIGDIAAKGDEVGAHLKRVGLVVGNLPDCGKGLQLFVAVQTDFGAVIQQPIAALHAVERGGFAVADLAETACHAAQNVFLANRANPVFHVCSCGGVDGKRRFRLPFRVD